MPFTPPPTSPTADPAIRVRRRYHLGIAGAVYIFVTLLVALGAFNSQNNLLFWTFGFALALLIISGVLSGAMLMGLDVIRETPMPIAENDTGIIHYRVRNRNRIIPAFALTISEVSLPIRGKPAPEAAPCATSPRVFVPHVAPGRTVSIPGAVRGLRRGPEPFQAMLVSTSFPFGIIKKSLLFEQPGEILVRPALRVLPHGFVNSALRMGDRGLTPTRRAGQGDEFFSLREYQPGDGLRAIAWRASARRGDLLVKQTAAPAPMRLQVLLRLLGSTGSEADEEAIRLAASAVDAAVARNIAVGLHAIGGTGADAEVRPRDGRMQRELIMDTLARLSPDAIRAAYSPDANHPDFSRQHRTPGVVVFVHAGPPDLSIAPPGAIHLSATQPSTPSA